MKPAGIALISILFLFSHPTHACSLVAPQPAAFDPTAAKSDDRPPQAPTFTVHVRRGNADTPADTCGNLGVIRLSIPATRENRHLLYVFEVVDGQRPYDLIDYGPSMGFVENNEIVFPLPWLDGATTSQEPLAFVIRATPYRRSGQQGAPVDIVVNDPGK